MSLKLSLVALLVVVSCVAAFDSKLDSSWENFKKTFGKVYYAPVEDNRRREMFEYNVAAIVKHNLEHDLGKHTYRKGLNQFADMLSYEFRQQMNGFRGQKT